WGSCLGLVNDGCSSDPTAADLDVGVPAGGTMHTQADSPDEQVIPITAEVRDELGSGLYQLVTLTNPYGLLREDGGATGSISCVTIHVAVGVTGFGEVSVTPVNLDPATCRLPAAIDPPLTGPDGF